MKKLRVSSAAFRNRKAVLLDVRARKKTARKRRRMRLFNLLWKTGTAAALVIGTWYGANKLLTKFFYGNPDYNIRQIALPSEDTLSKKEFFAATGLHTGMNIFTIDLDKARNALLALPQIRNVSIERVLPDTLRIQVEDKKPIAWLISEKDGKDPYSAPDSFLLEQQGNFYRPTHFISRYSSLPVIYGIDRRLLTDGDLLTKEDLQQALELLRLVAERKDPQLRLRALDLSEGYCIKARGLRNETIVFDTENFEAQLDRLQELMRFCKRAGKQIEYVNLFVHRNTPVRFSMISGEILSPHTDNNAPFH